MHQSNPIVPILPQLHCGAFAYHVGPWEGVSASFALPGARAFAYPGASPELLACSQSLYFLFKVRRARVIKYKPRGIYWPPAQRGRGGGRNSLSRTPMFSKKTKRKLKQRLCTVYRPFDTHVVSYPIITKHGGFYRKHKQIGRLVHLSRMRKTRGVWELEMVVVRLYRVRLVLLKRRLSMSVKSWSCTLKTHAGKKRTKEITAGWLKRNLSKQGNPTYSTRNGLGKAKENLEEQMEESDRLRWEHDDLEQYSRKNSLEIHGIPQDACSDTEAALIKVAEPLNITIEPEDIYISHKI